MKIHLCFILGLLLLMTGCGPALRQAAIKGDINSVKALLDQGVDVNESFYSETPLMLASYYGHIEIVKMLLDRGADIDKAIWGLREDTVTQAKDAVVVLKEFKQQRIARKPVTSKTSTETLLSIPSIRSDVDELPPVQAKPNKNAYAIVIGVEKYRQKLPKADFADHDARVMAEYLTKVMGYPEENIVMLINDHAARSDFEKYLGKWLPNNVEKDSSVFVYYSGHGAPNSKTGDAYLVPYDGDPSFIEETGYPLKRLYAKLDKLPAREIVVVLDSCFSGAGGRSVLAKGARPLVMNMDKQVLYSDRIAVLTASAGNQISSTHEEKGHGLFTYFFLKGIKDGNSELGTLYNYLKPQVERIARKMYNNEQTPGLIAPKRLLNLRLYDR
ncbi:MAG: caspase family protein [Deltaproteobacteria bacterium]|nr:caspase family protein [Deltaproteobacteria bacterium]